MPKAKKLSEPPRSLIRKGMVVSHAQVELNLTFSIAHEVMILAVEEWLKGELGLEFKSQELSSQGCWTFELAGSHSIGYVSVSLTREEIESGAEIVVEAPFYLGVERNRFRLLGSESSTLEISTTMESQDSTRPEFDIPRLTDSFLKILESVFGQQLISQGEPIQSGPWMVQSDRESIEGSPLANSSDNFGLPIVIIGNDAASLQRLSSLAAEFFGLAHLVALSPELIPRNVPDFALGVFWKDGSSRPDYFSRRADWRAVYRQLVRGAVRRSEFESKWRDHVFRATAEQDKGQESTNLSDNPSLTLAYAELADRNSELEQRLTELEAELVGVQIDSESFLRQWEESENKVLELRSMLRSQNYAALSKYSSDADFRDIVFYVDLGSGSIDDELNDLVSQTGGAIVFTNNVARSWLAARKAGSASPEKMANNLGKLCRFALDYRFLGGALGMPVAEYAKNNFDLDVITFDEKLPEKYFDFDGARHNQEHHIKADDSRESFDSLGRIHFALDPAEKRVIVNHMGRKLYHNDKS